MDMEDLDGIAIAALLGIIASGAELDPAEASTLAYDYADAMAAAKAKRTAASVA